jgi:hypothetical protein
MLPLKVIEEVRRLLDENRHSQRRIAEIVGVGRGTVNAIAAGKRGYHGREHDVETEADERVAVRCPGCGARVYLPCVLCRARAYNLQRDLSRWLAARNPRRVA